MPPIVMFLQIFCRCSFVTDTAYVGLSCCSASSVFVSFAHVAQYPEKWEEDEEINLKKIVPPARCMNKTGRIQFSGVLYSCLKTLRLLFGSEVLFLFLWTPFLQKIRYGQLFFLVPQLIPIRAGDLLMEANSILMKMKLQWKLVHSENPELWRRKMARWAFDQFRERLSVYLYLTHRVVRWKFLSLKGAETLAVMVGTAVVLSYSHSQLQFHFF